jgi:hypothetical protein
MPLVQLEELELSWPRGTGNWLVANPKDRAISSGDDAQWVDVTARRPILRIVPERWGFSLTYIDKGQKMQCCPSSATNIDLPTEKAR